MFDGFCSLYSHFVICLVSIWQTKVKVFNVQIQIWYDQLKGEHQNLLLYMLP